MGSSGNHRDHHPCANSLSKRDKGTLENGQRGTRRDSKGHEGTASTFGHVGGITAATERPKGTDFMQWLGFSMEQEAKIMSKGASPSLEVTWPGSGAPTMRPFLSGMNAPLWKCSTALIKLQKPLPNVDGRKIPPFPGQPCPSSCNSARAGLGILNLECILEKQR